MIQSLESILAQELESVGTFIAILREEHDVLRDGPVDDLGPLREKKLALVEHLNTLEGEREKLLPKAAAKTAAVSMEAYLIDKPEASHLAAQWKKLLELARQAKELHQLNAKILTGLLDRTDEAINVLRAKQKSTPLYGSDGQVSAGSGSRIVDLA